MKTSRIKARLRANEPALVTTLAYSDPAIHEMVSLSLGRHTLSLLLVRSHNPGVSYSVTF